MSVIRAYRLLLFALPILAASNSNISAVAQESRILYNGEVTGGETVYEVQPGDILYKIAVKLGTSFPAIARANSIKNPNQIFAGQKLVIASRKIIPRILDEGVLINIPEYRLYFFHNREVVDVYPIAVGLKTWRIPTGSFKIIRKIQNPTWYMPEGMAKRLGVEREIIPPGPLNPVGDLWIGLDMDHVGIHSTNQPMSIGKSLSHGCIRLYPWDAHKLFDAVELGMLGEIIYEPIKVSLEGKDIFLEVHEDVYRFIPNMEEEALRKLSEFGIMEDIDLEKVKETVKKTQGLPVKVNKTQNKNSSIYYY